MPKRLPEVLLAYDPGPLDEMLWVLSRASKDAAELAFTRLQRMREELESDLLAVLRSTRLAHDGSEQAVAWHEFTSDAPTYVRLAAGYKAMAKAADPLDPEACTRELRPGMSAQMRVRWLPNWRRQGLDAEPSVQTVDWDLLSIAEQTEIREMARHLSRFHPSFVRRGRPHKGDLDAALRGLADLFLRYSLSQAHPDSLPYAEESRFIQFAVLALSPAAAWFETANWPFARWMRVVKPEAPSRLSARKAK